jgi:hypothetical protein
VNPIEGLVDLALVEIEEGAERATRTRHPQRSPARQAKKHGKKS